MVFSKRIQFFEFLDLTWLPNLLRRYLLEYLNFFLYKMTRPYRGVEAMVADWVGKAGHNAVLDMGSGGGGHIEFLIARAETQNLKMPKLVVSDLHPDAEINAYKALKAKYGEDRVDFIERPVNAFRPEEADIRLRSMFSAFHHLSPDQVREMFKDVCANSDGIMIVDGTRRAVLPVLLMLLQFPVFMFLYPFVVPNFSWGRLFFSIVVPLLPFMMTFDSVVSMLRAYTMDEIKSLFPPEARDRFVIEGRTLPVLGGIFHTNVLAAYRRQPPRDAAQPFLETASSMSVAG